MLHYPQWTMMLSQWVMMLVLHNRVWRHVISKDSAQRKHSRYKRAFYHALGAQKQRPRALSLPWAFFLQLWKLLKSRENQSFSTLLGFDANSFFFSCNIIAPIFENYSPKLMINLFWKGTIGAERERDELEWKIVSVYFLYGQGQEALCLFCKCYLARHSQTYHSVLILGGAYFSIHSAVIILQRLHFHMRYRLWSIMEYDMINVSLMCLHSLEMV